MEFYWICGLLWTSQSFVDFHCELPSQIVSDARSSSTFNWSDVSDSSDSDSTSPNCTFDMDWRSATSAELPVMQNSVSTDKRDADAVLTQVVLIVISHFNGVISLMDKLVKAASDAQNATDGPTVVDPTVADPTVAEPTVESRVPSSCSGTPQSVYPPPKTPARSRRQALKSVAAPTQETIDCHSDSSSPLNLRSVNVRVTIPQE